MGAHVEFATTRLPSVLPIYLRTLRPRSGAGKIRSGAQLPNIATSWRGARFDEQHVARYRELCQLPAAAAGSSVPILYPHTFLGPLHLDMLTHEAFPLGLIGSVHLRNHIIQHKPMRADEAFDVRMSIDGGRRRPQGVEIDLSTTLEVDGALAWESVSTFLVRQKAADAADVEPESPRAASAANIGCETHARALGAFAIPGNTGKAFGLLTRDINPIHTSFVLAKLLGFERDLVHGMWGLGRALSFFGSVDMARPVRLDCAFKGPMYMERDVRILQAGEAFEMYSGTNPRPSIVGRVANIGGGGDPRARL